MELDHVFVCCAPGAPEGDALVELGLREGEGNSHPGQGTANRRFFFANAYLELLFVRDADEARREPRLRLWERCTQPGVCPFGLIFRPGLDEAVGPPFPTWAYRPSYLPEGLALDMAEGVPLGEPELVYMAFGKRRETSDDPRRLTGVEIAGPGIDRAPATRAAEAAGIGFAVADAHVMTLTLEHGQHGQRADLRPRLPLVIRW